MYQLYRFLIVGCVFLISNYSFSQITIEGVLLDDVSHEPIAFATIGIAEISVGSVSNQDGSFKLHLHDSLTNYQITFSMIGYDTKKVNISQLVNSGSKVVFLHEKVTELESVVITGDKTGRLKRKILGNTQFNTGTMRLDEATNGGSMALLISYKDVPYTIYGAKLWITYNSLPSFKVRVRVMSVDSLTGAPGTDLLSESVVLESDIEKGWLDFNLVRNNIKIQNQDFYLVFEWIMDHADRRALLDQVTKHLSDKPEAMTEDQISVGKETVKEQVIKDYNNGVWFGSLLHPVMGNQFTCYYRLNMFDDWKPSAAKLTAAVTLFQ